MISELEHVVLGVVWQKQPCTAYAVRVVFLESPSSHWSGSAGAIYPLMRRLAERRLLRTAPRRGDGRASRLYRLTARGLDALRAWLRPPLPPGAALMNVDPVRVRLCFLDALPRNEQLAAVEEARDKLRALLADLRNESRRNRTCGDRCGYLADRGAILSVQAQVAWLGEVQRYLAALPHETP